MQTNAPQHDEDVNSFVSDLENFKLEETVSASHAEENIVFLETCLLPYLC